MKDNFTFFHFYLILVVNCFQKLLSSWWRTTTEGDLYELAALWIAFKNYYLRDEGQLCENLFVAPTCCELLSKIIIFVMKDNFIVLFEHENHVVNCFQKLLSSWWRTTCYSVGIAGPLLWIAFKNYYLRDEGQQRSKILIYSQCCELLSKIIIFVMKDNGRILFWSKLHVVNCFQKLLSSWWRTTCLLYSTLLTQLWIAFKNYYLRDEGQHWIKTQIKRQRCELLSKIIIFVMKDNQFF